MKMLFVFVFRLWTISGVSMSIARS